jgi:uncharacterized membrane protein YfcA
MEIPLSTSQILVAWLIIVGSAWVQGSVGFGMGLISAPLLYMLDPILVPAPLAASALVLLVLMIRRDGREVHWKELRWPLLGRLLGMIPAILVLRYFSDDGFSIALGSLLLVAVAMSICGVHFAPTRRNLLCAGAVSGFMGTTTATAGPAIALVYQKEEAARLRGVLSWYFLIGGVITFPAFYLGGRFGMPELVATIILAPAAALGYALSTATFHRVEKRGLRGAVLSLSALSGIAVIIRGFS